MLNGMSGELADLLFELGAIKFGAFRLKLHETNPDAPLSPIYLNLRTPDNPKPGPLTSEAIRLVADLMFEKVAMVGVRSSSLIAGIPNAADPIVDVLAVRLKDWPVRRIHLVKETSADIRRIVGLADDPVSQQAIGTGADVLVVDDLITGADSKLETIGALQAAGLDVIDLLVLVDREQGGAKQLRDMGYRVHAVLTLGELLDHYVETGKIEIETAEGVRDYLAGNS